MGTDTGLSASSGLMTMLLCCAWVSAFSIMMSQQRYSNLSTLAAPELSRSHVFAVVCARRVSPNPTIPQKSPQASLKMPTSHIIFQKPCKDYDPLKTLTNPSANWKPCNGPKPQASNRKRNSKLQKFKGLGV